MKNVLKKKLFGEGIYLRELTLKEATSEYCGWLNDGEVNKYLETWSATKESVAEYIKTCRRSSDTILLGIFDRDDNKHIGNVKLGPIVDWNKKRTVYGIMVGDKNYWGKGIGTAATKLAIEVAFNILDLNEIELGVVGDNAKARKVFEKSGFKVLEIRKDGLQYRGKIYDKVVMEIKKNSDDIHQKTLVFTLNKNMGVGKRVVLGASEPLAFKALLPIIDGLRKDERCDSIALVTDNISGRSFAEHFKNDKEWKSGRELGNNFDVILSTLDAYDSPGMMLVRDGKDLLGAKKIFVLHYSWTSAPKTKNLLKNRGDIDGIFCNDGLAKEIISFHLPDLRGRIFVTGTPVIEDLELLSAKKDRKTGRNLLGVQNEEFVALYLGDTYEDYKDDRTIDGYLNKKTLQNTVEAMIGVAKVYPQKNFVLLLRPHPRDPNKFEILSYVHNKPLPFNLRLIPAIGDKLSIAVVTYTADVILSIISTENHLAPFRGRRAVFLGFLGSKNNLGGKIIEDVFGSRALAVLKKSPWLGVVSSSDELKIYFQNFATETKILPRKNNDCNSAKRILRAILS